LKEKKLKILFTISTSLISVFAATAQIDTTSYAEQRLEIRALMQHRKPDVAIDCKDFIAVGPKGDISFSHQQWQNVQRKEKVVFKSVTVVPGSEIIRIYDEKMAVVNFIADVKLNVDGRDLNIKVRRLEVFHKTAGSWCRVAGQGTEIYEKLFPIKGNVKDLWEGKD
jgi:hypothetical protein